MNEIKSIRLVISQPPTGKTDDEWDFFVDEAMERTQATVTEKAGVVLSLIGKPLAEVEPHLVVGEKQCHYCKAKADCPAYAKFVDTNTETKFEVLPAGGSEAFMKMGPADLVALYLKTPMIRKWCDVIDAKVQALTMSGDIKESDGLKVVAGKNGNREWDNPAEVEVEMKSMRLKSEEMYKYSLITPTVAEKVLADNPRKWKKLSGRIVQAPGKPVVVPSNDKRPAIDVRPSADGFDEVPDGKSPPPVETAVVEDLGDDLC